MVFICIQAYLTAYKSIKPSVYSHYTTSHLVFRTLEWFSIKQKVQESFYTLDLYSNVASQTIIVPMHSYWLDQFSGCIDVSGSGTSFSKSPDRLKLNLLLELVLSVYWWEFWIMLWTNSKKWLQEWVPVDNLWHPDAPDVRGGDVDPQCSPLLSCKISRL